MKKFNKLSISRKSKKHSKTDSSASILGSDGSSSNVSVIESIKLTNQTRVSTNETQVKESTRTLKKEEVNKENYVRNILLIGKTGNGKSTLANVLTDTNEFKEGKYASSETKEIKSREFKNEGIQYRIVDTVGMSDTESSQEKVLEKLAEACWYIEEKVNQILFVIKDRFTEEEKLAYNLLREVIFDENVNKYTTIVRTGFSSFEEHEECQKDKEILIKNNKEIANIVNCYDKIIHVDNPEVNIENERKKKINEEEREKSRKILMKHLKGCSKVYESKNFYREKLDNLNSFIERRKKIIAEVEAIREKLNKKNKMKKVASFAEPAAGIITAASGVGAVILNASPNNLSSEFYGTLHALDAAGEGAKSLAIITKLKLENDEEELLKEFGEKIKEDEQNQKKYLSQLIHSEEKTNTPTPTFSLLGYVESKIKGLHEGLGEVRKEKDKYKKTIDNWEERKEELKEKIEKFQSNSNEKPSSTV